MSKKTEDINYLERRVSKLHAELDNQVRGETTPVERDWGLASGGEPTLNGKLEALARHLGVNFEVSPEEVIVTKIKKGKK